MMTDPLSRAREAPLTVSSIDGIRGRFAPSPTGPLHLGTARTALLAWLRVRHQGGALILRLEDLDAPRVRPGAAEALLHDLAWLGLDWDEGPDKGGPVGPYAQSARQGLYEDAFERLRSQGRLYRCSCSRKDVDQVQSAPHGEDGPLYPGHCRGGLRQAGRPTVWRFRMEASEPFEDAIQGPQAGLQDDFVVRRADGVYSYQFACAVDDAAMGVTEVLRGADLLGSASRQQALLKALAAAVPTWAHAPLLVGADGQRLAKRHGATAVAQWRLAGWSPQRVVGLLAAGLGLDGEGAAMTPRQLLAGLPPGAWVIPAWTPPFAGPWPLDH